MITNDMFDKYSNLTLKILPMYSPNTIITLLNLMSSDEAVLKMEQILSTNPSEEEVLEKIQEVFQVTPEDTLETLD